jgi:hypothetical protein
MSTLIRLASDFIEKMNNPSYGPLINEEYSLRFTQLIGEEGFSQLIKSEIELIRDPDELNSYGWLWLINWCKVNDVRIPERLSMQLMSRWSNVFMQAAIIDLFTNTDKEPKIEYSDNQPRISNKWISQIVENSTSTIGKSDTEKEFDKEKPFNIVSAQNLLIALLQVGNRASIVGAQYLLEYNWPGKDRLQFFFSQRLERLDEETRKAWIQQINPGSF